MSTCNTVTVNTSTNTVTVNQGTTKVVTVNSIGPQGPVGPQGPAGGGGGSSVWYDGTTFITSSVSARITGSLKVTSHISSSGNVSASGLLYVSASQLPGQSYNVLVQDTSTGRVYYTGSYSSGGGGGSTSPGGSDTQVQFNDGGSFGGDTGFTFNKTTNAITAISEITSSGIISSSDNIHALSFIGGIDGGGF